MTADTLKIIALKPGAHEPNGQACAMEAAAYIAGEKWSDTPECVSPVIGAFMRSWNDSLPTDADRDRLLAPLLLDTLGTRGPAEIETARAWMATDWLIREYTPAWMELTEALRPHAAALRGLPEINAEPIGLARPVLAAARDAAWAAAGDAASAAWAAASAAAGAAASAAAGDAAGAAAWAAGAAARDAAGDAARNAAWAAGAAARDALAPSTARLQISAQDLVRRMCALHRTDFKPVRSVRIGDLVIGAGA